VNSALINTNIFEELVALTTRKMLQNTYYLQSLNLVGVPQFISATD
jgi:hypothetical protein